MGRIILSIIVGILLGIIGSRFLLVGSSLNLIPWAIAGLILGYISLKKNDAIKNGGIYGFFLSFTFMLSGYTGASPIITRVPFFLALGIFGAVCGAILSLIGNFLKDQIKH